MATPRRPARAFSLLELVITLAIIGVLAAIGSPRYINSLSLYRSQAAAKRIAADLNLARSRARASSLGQTLTFSLASNSYTLPGVAGMTGNNSAYAVSLASEPYVATILSVSSATFTFDRYGQPAAGGTVVVQSGTSQQTVLLDAATGVARVQ